MNNTGNIFSQSPFKIGCLVIILSCLIFFSFGGNKPDLLERLDNQIIDAMFRWRGTINTSNSVVIVDIDEKSLNQLGQWPWPRNIVARLLDKLNDSQPKVIGFDTVFAEGDRTSLKNMYNDIAPLLDPAKRAILAPLTKDSRFDHDLILGNAIAQAPTVLGYVFQIEDDGFKQNNAVPFPAINITIDPASVNFTQLSLIPAYRAILNVPDVAMGMSEGFFNVFPDPAGTVRKVPLFMALDDVPYPSLALEMYRIGSNSQKVTIHCSANSNTDNYNFIGVSITQNFIPTDHQGQVTVNFRGPMKTFPYVSAIDILNGIKQESLRNKYVLIGTSAAGLLDLRATPYSNVFAGVEVHANVLDNLIQQDPLIYDIYTEIGLTYTVIIFGGLLLTALLAYSSPLIGGFGGMLLVTLYLFYGNYKLLFLRNQLVGITYPLLTILAIFLIVTIFNYFFKEREKRFIQGAFGHYVSPDVVKELISSPEKLTLLGEEKNTTIFFNDIRGFTTISESMSPPELAVFMNEYLTEMSTIIMDNKGTVDKYIGDAIMAIWGAPLDDEQHATNAVRASLAMMRRLKELQIAWQKKGLPFVDIGIGLNTGLVSVGNFGSEQRFDYTVLGDNVNLASRLEGLNKLYGTNILISESTRETIGDAFFYSFVDKVRVKGKEQAITIYQPMCEGTPSCDVLEENEKFKQAISLYYEQQFSEAEQILTELNKRRQATIYQLYLDRITSFNTTPPPVDWDGVYTATSK